MTTKMKRGYLLFILICFFLCQFSPFSFNQDEPEFKAFNIKWGTKKADFLKPDYVIEFDMDRSVLIYTNYFKYNVRVDLFFTRFPFKRYPDYLSGVTCFFEALPLNDSNLKDSVSSFRYVDKRLTEIYGEPDYPDHTCKRKDYKCFLEYLKSKKIIGMEWNIRSKDIYNNEITLTINHAIELDFNNNISQVVVYMVD